MTEVTISVVGTDEDSAELEDLFSSIIDDDSLKRVQKSNVPGEPAAGTMGVEDVIRVIVENPEVGTALAGCVSAWIATRSRSLKIRFKGAGREVEVEYDGKDSEPASEVLAAIYRMIGEETDRAPTE